MKITDEYKTKLPELIQEGLVAYNGKIQGMYTREDYALLPEGTRAELIHGRIYAMGSPMIWHQALVTQVGTEFTNYIRKNRGSCLAIFASLDTIPNEDDETVVQPDGMVLCDRSKIRDGRVHGAPDFVLEVLSPSTGKRDRTLKLEIYRSAGVREYWMADPEKRKIIVYEFEKQEVPEIYGFDSRVPVGIFGGDLVIDLPRICENIGFLFDRSEKRTLQDV